MKNQINKTFSIIIVVSTARRIRRSITVDEKRKRSPRAVIVGELMECLLFDCLHIPLMRIPHWSYFLRLVKIFIVIEYVRILLHDYLHNNLYFWSRKKYILNNFKYFRCLKCVISDNFILLHVNVDFNLQCLFKSAM